MDMFASYDRFASYTRLSTDVQQRVVHPTESRGPSVVYPCLCWNDRYTTVRTPVGQRPAGYGVPEQ